MLHKRKSNKRVMVLIAVGLIVSLLATATPLHSFADNGDAIVHVTRTGKCYHRGGCGHLRSDIEMTLRDAVKEGYRPCEDCKPPIYEAATDVAINAENSVEENVQKENSIVSMPSNVNNTTVTFEPINSNPQYKTQASSIIENNYWWAWLIPAAILLYVVHLLNKQKKINNAPSKKETEADELLRQQYYSMYAGKNPIDLVNVPEGTFLKDGYPSTEASTIRPYGKYTVYVGKNPEVFHLNWNCGGARLEPINYSQACRLRHCKNCAMGNVNLPQLEWYIRYLEIVKIKSEYNIP